jgi:hypothetical protein
MTTTDFERWLKQGRGKAAEFIRNEAQSHYQDALLHACTHDLRYDPECDEVRGYYLANLIRMTADPRPFREGVAAVLKSPTAELHANDFLQMFALARHWAADGDEDIRRLVYDVFSREGFGRAEVGCGVYLVKMDGLDALLFVLPFLERVEERFRLWQFNYLASELEERDGKEAVAQALADTATKSPEVKRLQELARAEDDRLAKEAEEFAAERNAPYSELRSQLPAGKHHLVSLLYWASKATEDELRNAAADMFAETNQRQIWNYLMLFSRRRFPGPIEPLIDLVRNGKPFLSHAAARVLSILDDPEVRSLGLELLGSDYHCSLGVRLLARRRQPGDYGLIEAALQRDLSKSAYHVLCGAVLEFVKANIDGEAFDSLQLIFEKSLSSDCRCRTVKHFLDLHCLPDWMREECHHDAESETRELVAEKTISQ